MESFGNWGGLLGFVDQVVDNTHIGGWSSIHLSGDFEKTIDWGFPSHGTDDQKLGEVFL
jgi:hypothetical protein